MTRFHLILTGLAVAQVVVLLALGDGGSASDDISLDSFRPLKDLAPDQIGELTIEKPGSESVHVKRASEGWVLADAGDYPAKESQMETAAKALRKLYAIRALTDDPARYHGLKVSPDKFDLRITVKDRDGAVTDDFYLGELPGGDGKLVYRKANDDTAWSARGPQSWDLEPTVSEWVDTSYFDVSQDDVRKVEVKNGDKTLTLTATVTTTEPDGEDPAAAEETVAWSVTTEGEPAEADPPKVSSWLASLTGVRLKRPIGQEVLTDYGLGAATITLTMKDDTTHTLQLGVDVPDDSKDRYLKSSASPFVVTVSSWVVTDLFEKQAADLLPTEEPKSPDGGDK